MANTDKIPNKQRVIGSSGWTDKDRQIEDYYATDPIAIAPLFDFNVLQPGMNVLECCCGEGNLSKRLEAYGCDIVESIDKFPRGYGETKDFFNLTSADVDKHNAIVTNPPYKDAAKFVRHALSIAAPGTKVCMLLRILFLESKDRYALFNEWPLSNLLVCNDRLVCAENNLFHEVGGSIQSYAWFVWTKGKETSKHLQGDDWYNANLRFWLHNSYRIPNCYRLISMEPDAADFMHATIFEVNPDTFVEFQFIWDSRKVKEIRPVSREYYELALTKQREVYDRRDQIIVAKERLLAFPHRYNFDAMPVSQKSIIVC